MKKIFLVFLCTLFLPITSGCKRVDNTTKYNMQLNLKENILYGEMQVELTLATNGFVDFNLFGVAYKENATFFAVEQEYLPTVKNYGDMQIMAVNSSKFVAYELVENNALLRVYLNAKKGQRVNVYINFKVTLSNFCHRLSSDIDTINLGNFYPILCVYENGYTYCPYYNIGDPFYSQVANYSVSLTCQGQYVVASSGFCEKVEYNNEETTYFYTLNNARDFAFCLSKNFKVQKETFNNIDIYYYYLTGDYQTEISLIKDGLTYFMQFYNYPYKTYSVCQSDFCYGGMEYPALVYVNKTLVEQEKFFTIIHETAHQWWYGIVGNNQITNACLDEGLAEFSSVIFFEKYQKYGISYKNLLTQKITNYSSFSCAYKLKYGLDATLSPKRSLPEYKNSVDYTFTAYYYMPYCCYQLYHQDRVGFLNSLKNFAKDFAFKIATLLDFKGYLNEYQKIYYDTVLSGRAIKD